MDHLSPGHDQNVCNDFKSLVSERHLPIEMVSKPIVLSQGALYKYRMVRDTDLASANNNKRSGSDISSSVPSTTAIEMRIFMHVLTLHRILMEIGLRELAEPPPKDADSENDLAQRITAAFRRTLPALRIAGKWLKANYKYVMQNETTAIISTATKHEGRSPAVAQFWETYAHFFCALSRAFPMERLPSLKAPLEEDVEMRGFLPLRKMMGETRLSNASENGSTEGLALSQTREEVHPNEEQLMRISDLLFDARAVVEMEVRLYFLNSHSSFFT